MLIDYPEIVGEQSEQLQFRDPVNFLIYDNSPDGNRTRVARLKA